MEARIGRLESDLETMKTAVGLGPRMGIEDVWGNLALGCVGLLMTASELVPLELPPVVRKLVLLLSWVGVALFFAWKYRSGAHRTTARDREWSFCFPFTAAVTILILMFNVWLQAVGVKGLYAVGGTLFLSGACLVPIALTDRWRLPYLGWALPFLLYGFSQPWMMHDTWRTLLGASIFVGGVATAGILALQLRALPAHSEASCYAD